jgi:hypothetical protein
VSDEDGRHILILCQKISIIARAIDEPYRWKGIWVVEGADMKSFTALKFGDSIIWSDDGTAEAVPAYVYAYDDYRNGGEVDA